jgi:hypothetical protein
MTEPICPDCEPHDDGGFICDPARASCPYAESAEVATAYYDAVNRIVDAGSAEDSL